MSQLLRIVFISVAIVIVVSFVRKTDKTHTKKASSPKILGEERHNTSTTSPVEKTLDKGTQVVGNLIDNTTNFVQSEASNAAALVANMAVQNTAKGVASQIQKLSPDQQKELKTQICK